MECASRTWPASSWSREESAPWRTPGRPAPRRCDADEPDGVVGVEGVEETDGVGAAAHAGDGVVREPALSVQHLPPRLRADDRLEVADDHRGGGRPDGGGGQGGGAR